MVISLIPLLPVVHHLPEYPLRERKGSADSLAGYSSISFKILLLLKLPEITGSLLCH
jgi:hypothetical protein